MSIFFEKNATPSDPVPGVEEISSARIKFINKGVFFYRNSFLNSDTNVGLSNFENFVKSENPISYRNSINVYLSQAQGGGGSTNFPNYYNSYAGQGIVMYGNHKPGEIDFTATYFSSTLRHELGHCFHLRHTYSNESSPAAKCNMNSGDYLDDLFNRSGGECPHEVARNISVWQSDNDKITNNIMGGSWRESKYYSPQQARYIWRTIMGTNVEKYVLNCPKGNKPFIVTHNLKVSFPYRIYQDVVIQSKDTLEVNCTLKLPNNATIYLNPGAHLKVTEGGEIIQACSGETFTNIINVNDCMIADDKTDTGNEPNHTARSFSNSPAIWVRHIDDGEREHQDPIQGKSNVVYVEINSKGTSPFQPVTVQLYWCIANKDTYWPESWNGSIKENGYPIGGSVSGYAFQNGLSEGKHVLKFNWTPPPPGRYNPNPKYYSLLVNIQEEAKPNQGLYMPKTTNNTYEIIKNNNNMAMSQVRLLYTLPSGYIINSKIAVFPNPNTGRFSVQHNYQAAYKLQYQLWIDETPIEEGILEQQHLFDVSAKKGVYILKVYDPTTGEEIFNEKIRVY